jgi:hypothetical protein
MAIRMSVMNHWASAVRAARPIRAYMGRYGDIPAWRAPIKDRESGPWITSHVMNQDFVAWVGQVAVADRDLLKDGLPAKVLAGQPLAIRHAYRKAMGLDPSTPSEANVNPI